MGHVASGSSSAVAMLTDTVPIRCLRCGCLKHTEHGALAVNLAVMWVVACFRPIRVCILSMRQLATCQSESAVLGQSCGRRVTANLWDKGIL